jgi:hypothetical protein
VLGFIPNDYKEDMGKGWAWILERTKRTEAEIEIGTGSQKRKWNLELSAVDS